MTFAAALASEGPRWPTIVRLVGQVVRVSVETVKIVGGLPEEIEPAAK